MSNQSENKTAAPKILTGCQLRPVLECCISHLTARDAELMQALSRIKFEGEWIMDTGVGYLIRLDAHQHPLRRLRKSGLSRAARQLISRAVWQLDIGMIHFSQAGDELDGVPVFDW